MYRSAIETALLFLLSLHLLISGSHASSPETPLQPSSDSPSKRVAIIGAGSAGSSTAHYLRKHAHHLPLTVNITVYERSSYIGGRSTTINAYDLPSQPPVELGASIFVEVNRNLYTAAQELGLTLKSASDDRPQEAGETLGVWNGRDFVFTQSSGGYYWWDVAKLLWKYGLAPIRTQRLMKATVGRFLKMYDKPNFPWSSLTEVALEMGLLEATTVTGRQFLEANGIQSTFARDIIQASTRVNYGQNLGTIHGLETMVCMATDGAVAIEGGNWRIFAGMLEAAKARVRLNRAVTEIQRNENWTYTVISEGGIGETSEEELYDRVILAAPLQYSSLKIGPSLTHTPDEIPYVKLYVTLFASPHTLCPQFFNLDPSADVPETILTTLPLESTLAGQDVEDAVGPAGFWSISTLRHTTNPASDRKEYLYKIFSPNPLTPGFMGQILGFHVPDSLSQGSLSGISKKDLSWLHEKTWHSYPYLYPRVTFEHLLLDADEEDEEKGGLWYTSGVESFISTMETSSLMGANVAALIARRWEKELEGKESVLLQENREGAEL